MSTPLEYQSIIENFVLTEQGRVVPRLLSFFVQNFDHVPGQWRARTWSVRDCEILSQYVDILDCNTFVIPTHRLDQIEFLQSQFSNSITVGITYPKNMFPLVLKIGVKKLYQLILQSKNFIINQCTNICKTKICLVS